MARPALHDVIQRRICKMFRCPHLTWTLPAVFLLIAVAFAQNSTLPTTTPDSSDPLSSLVDPSTPEGAALLGEILAQCPPTDDTSTLECCTIGITCSYISNNCAALGLPENCSGIAATACDQAAGILGVDAGSCCCAGSGDTTDVSTLPPLTASPTGSSPISSATVASSDVPVNIGPTQVVGPPTGIPPIDSPAPAGATPTPIPEPWECEGDFDDLDPCCKAVRICSVCAHWCWKEGAHLECYQKCPEGCAATLDDYGFPEGKSCCCPLGNS
jgi:hypothetical protein